MGNNHQKKWVRVVSAILCVVLAVSLLAGTVLPILNFLFA